ncbi:MAG: FHA domain-containing protein [Planctomycetota bacterium]
MQGNWVIGSDPKRADLVIPDLEVDGVHCVLRIHKDGTVQVADMGSGGHPHRRARGESSRVAGGPTARCGFGFALVDR